jgi:hypothetical protein
MGRLAAWQKFGIVLSIAWAIGTAVHTHNRAVEAAQSSASFAYKVCADGKDEAHSPDLSECDKEKSDSVAESMQGDTANAAIVALAPLPFAWMFAFVLVGLGRALAIGLHVVLPWKSMSRPRKVFVVAGGLVSVGAALFGLTCVMGLYTDTLVPVSPGPKAMVTDLGDTVVVEGTWTREGPLGQGSRLADPLQTSKIICTQSDNRCVEGRAEVTSEGHVLMADVTDYDIESWSPTTIVFVAETPCARETYTIDRKTQAVNGVGTRLRSDAKICNTRVAAASTEDRWEYHLADGFKTYWDLHQQARPTLLKVVQAFFGN